MRIRRTNGVTYGKVTNVIAGVDEGSFGAEDTPWITIEFTLAIDGKPLSLDLSGAEYDALVKAMREVE